MKVIKVDITVLVIIVCSAIAESVHLLPCLHKVHSSFNGIDVYWGDVVYYVTAQISKFSLFGSIILIGYTTNKSKASYALSWGQLTVSSLHTIDEFCYMFKLNTNILFFEHTLPKLLFIFGMSATVFVIVLMCKNDSS